MLELAAAMAYRGVQEQLANQTILAAAMPLPPAPPVEIQERLQTGLTVILLKSLEDPEVRIDAVNLAAIMFDDQTVADVYRSFGEEPDEDSGQDMRAMAAAQLQVANDTFNPDGTAQEKLRATVANAERIAESHGVTVGTVFRDDGLYIEHMQTLHTPTEWVRDAMDGSEQISSEYMMNMISSTAAALAQGEIAKGLITPEEFEAEHAANMREMMEDESTLHELQALLSNLKGAVKKYTQQSLERFWGKQAVDELDEECREWLLGSRTVAEKLGGFMLALQQHADIIATYCMEQGWDPNKLTIPQMQEIIASPAMQEFFTEEN